MPRLSRRAVRAAIVTVAVMALIAAGTLLKRNPPPSGPAPAAAVQIR